MNATNGSVLCLGKSNTFHQTVSITDPFYVFSRLNILVFNRFEFPINGGNADYSFTLGFAYDKLIEQVKLKKIFFKL